jgi:UDP-N-acetylmuramoyl-L-alanyl-D-glutamate--2,6-diaminopimelate ligase
MELTEVLRGIQHRGVSWSPASEVAGIFYDSRQCIPGGLFVAVPGLKVDGHDYINDAIKRGARFIVHEKPYTRPPGITAIEVDDSRSVLGKLSRNFFSDPSARMCLIGVVGTNGKTTITYLMEEILNTAGFQVGVLGTINYRFSGKIQSAPNTTPESFEFQKILREMVDEGITHVVSEVSSHALDLRRVDDCAFDRGIFTNLSQDHLDYHGTMDQYFKAKERFFTEVIPAGGKKGASIIVNGDDPWGRKIIKKATLPVDTYGLEGDCWVTAQPWKLTLDGIKATLHDGDNAWEIKSNLIGKFNLYNILAAVTAALSLGLERETICRGVKNMKQIPGRLEKINKPGEPHIFVDYAHTEDALQRVLQDLDAFREGRVITVFGCGGDRDRGKRPRMGRAAVSWSDLTIITSDNPRMEDPLAIISEIESGIRECPVVKIERSEAVNYTGGKAYSIVPERREAIGAAIKAARPCDIVLIAGKGHEDYQIIGNRRLPFDDRLIAREILVGR